MSLLGAPIEQEQLNAICTRYPAFKGKLPPEAKFWTKAEVELYVKSNGKSRPQEVALKSSSTCSLLTRARVELAGAKIGDASSDYRSFCRYLRETKELARLPTVAEVIDVPKVQAAPEELRHPVVIEKQREWVGRMWNMDFWRRECGDDAWTCRAKSPYSADDKEGINSFAVEATVAEYVEYARLIHRVDRKCLEENSLAYPRLGLDGWLPFCERMLPLFSQCWREFRPPKLKDLTHRWVRLFSTAFGTDADVSSARYYQVSIRATGTIDRLHTESHGAHIWLNQIEGRRLFFLFPPQESSNLYAGHTTGESPVDLFFPSPKRHPKVAEAKCHAATLYLGQTLVIPAGWWWYSVALEASVTLSHTFWNLENKVYFTEGLKDNFDFSSGSRAMRENIVKNLDHIHKQVMADEDSDVDE